MPRIVLETWIEAPVERVFDLARSIDAHVASTDGTAEQAVAGRTTGLIELGETVTWEARHFGITQRLCVKITAMERPDFFVDEMLSGAFRMMWHRHDFCLRDGRTLMRDDFEFAAPCGLAGRLAERGFLTRYMERFLAKRAAVLKRMAETDEWRRFLVGE